MGTLSRTLYRSSVLGMKNAPDSGKAREMQARNIRDRRDALGMTREHLGWAIRGSFGGLRHIEDGRSWPTLDTAIRMAIVMETSLDELVSEDVYAAIAEDLPEPFRTRYFDRKNNVVEIETAAAKRAAKPVTRKKAVGETSTRSARAARVARRRAQRDDTGV